MSYGLRVWDASNNLELEITDRLPIYQAIYQIPELSYSQSFTVYHSEYSPSTWQFYANMPEYIEVTASNGSIVFRRWYFSSTQPTTPSFYVVLYKT